MIVLMVALGAAVGAPMRYFTDRTLQAWHPSLFPWGTLTVNLIASFVLGLITGYAGNLDPELSALIGTGFCGALSTYSTFSYETMRLVQTKQRFYAAANVLISLVIGLGAAAAGWTVGLSFS